MWLCFSFSAVISDEPECRVDVDCPPQMTCMRETCRNPCIVNNPCTSAQQCIVTDTFSSLRSVACVCPPGTLAGYGGTCTRVDPKPQCESDFECSNTEKCQAGSCVLACNLVQCGLNARCLSDFHSGKCQCNSGYFGDPYRYCEAGNLSASNTCMQWSDRSP